MSYAVDSSGPDPAVAKAATAAALTTASALLVADVLACNVLLVVLLTAGLLLRILSMSSMRERFILGRIFREFRCRNNWSVVRGEIRTQLVLSFLRLQAVKKH